MGPLPTQVLQTARCVAPQSPLWTCGQEAVTFTSAESGLTGEAAKLAKSRVGCDTASAAEARGPRRQAWVGMQPPPHFLTTVGALLG